MSLSVLHVLGELRPSGAEVMLKLAAPLWIKKGVELHVLALGENLGPYATQLRQAGFSVHHVPIERGIKLINGLWHYWKILRKINPCLVHVHQESLSLFMVLLAYSLGHRNFRTIHNNFGFSGILRAQKTIERWLCRMMGCKHIAISQSVQENEKMRFLNPSELIWNWFDTHYYRPPSEREKNDARRNLGIPIKKEVLVSIGNGSDVKNYIEIVRMLKKIQDPELYYLQVGFEHPEKKDRKEAEVLDISGQIRWCGPQENVRNYLWAADSYFMPSIFEGFGISAVEALACGLPCYLADVPGLKDLTQLGTQAFWVAPQANSLAQNYKERKNKPWNEGEINSKIVREFFSVDKGAEAYLRKWKSQEKNLFSKGPRPI